MTSIRLKFRPSSVPDKEGVLIYQVIHRRTARLVKSGYHIYPNEWNDQSSSLNMVTNNGRNEHLRLIRDKINWDTATLQHIIKEMEQNGLEFTTDDIVNAFAQAPQAVSVFSFINRQIIKLKRQRKIRTSEAYLSTLNSFSNFRDHEDLCFDAIDSDLMELYEVYLKDKGLVRNSSSFYMRNLRSVYNQAVEHGYTNDKKPFRHVYTGIDKTVKRAIPYNYIKKIKQLDLTLEPNMDFARDIFLFGFYTRGMSFIDIAYLKKTDLQNGYVTYIRKKTGQKLTYQWERQMEEIVRKHEKKNALYMLPIIGNEDEDERKQYHKMLKQIDRHLKKIAGRVGIDVPLTLYVARHSWASIAREKKIPTSVISEGMGHNSEITTQIYLKTLNKSVIDKANKKILSDI